MAGGRISQLVENRLPAPIAENYEWQSKAVCRNVDPEIFFLPDNSRMGDRTRRINAAKEICKTCPVISECLAYALDIKETYGIYGGMSEEERRRILLRRGR
jgi:WhiB family redox-sensing transcriptional regulator